VTGIPYPDSEATAWPRSSTTGRIRASEADFFVSEDLGFEPDGDGQHQLLQIRKTGSNTQWVARRLARAAGIAERDVGYSGLKDRRAVTEQWFSVPADVVPQLEAYIGAEASLELLRSVAHRRKLRRGSHAGNRFRIVIRDILDAGSDLDARLTKIAGGGVPNYFGPQRFGRDQGNLTLATRLAAGQRLRRRERGFALSAARSLMFNQLLSRRVKRQCWDRLLPGDVAALRGSRSVFRVDQVDAALEERIQTHDIHPSGPLWGAGDLTSAAAVRELECGVGRDWAEFAELLVGSGMKQERRPLRLDVEDMRWDIDATAATLEFRLTRGGFATAVLREILAPQTVASDHGLSRNNT